jgi:hypothetical protein
MAVPMIENAPPALDVAIDMYRRWTGGLSLLFDRALHPPKIRHTPNTERQVATHTRDFILVFTSIPPSNI